VADTTDPILSGLNPPQLEAVTHQDGPLLILAGAGSGKTKALTHRIAYLLAKGAPAFSILGVTFTNKAAGEMRERVKRLVDLDVWIQTFHATCLRILRQEAHRMDWPADFSIYDDSDQLTVIKACLAELKYDDRQVNPRAIREAISRAKDYLKTPELLANEVGDFFDEAVANVYARYQKKLEHYHAFDFGDLIMQTVVLLTRDNDALAHYQERFRHILVDEYQDTNHAQYRLIRMLASKYKQITVVGDPDQSIYRWRGADINNILNFERDYPGATWVKLEQNYRSSNNILEAANALILHNTERKHKELWSEKGRGELLTLFEARDEKEESLYIVRQITRLREEGRSLNDMVIFYRVHAQSRLFEDVFRRHKIPYQIIGGTRFYDRREIKDMIAYLKVLACPYDEVALKRVINVPGRGIGKKTLEALDRESALSGKSLFETLFAVNQISGIGAKAKKGITAFCRIIAYLNDQKTMLSPSELIQKVFESTGYLADLEKDNSVEAESRIENVREFLSVACDFETNAAEDQQDRMLEGFLESISLASNIDSWDEEESMTLMTLHTAKGLEFPVVFMVGLEEGVFPHSNTLHAGPAEMEEERRLCYVGMTRAQEKLHLSYAASRFMYGSRNYNMASRFLSELPSELYESENSLSRHRDVEEFDPFDDEIIEFD